MDGTITRFVWDDSNLLQETSDDGTTIQAHYTDYPGEWGGLTSMRRGSVSSFYSQDPKRELTAAD